MFSWGKDDPTPIEIISEGKIFGWGDLTPEIASCAGPQPHETPKDPEPDLSTKPDDVVGYCFGYVCPEKHVFSFFDSITLDGYRIQRLCQKCGGIGAPAVVRRIAEATWRDFGFYDYYKKEKYPFWGWSQIYDGLPIWTRYEFVHYLDSPKTRRKKKETE
jgi:hypothetical protein